MKKRTNVSAMLSAVLLVTVMLTGCGGSTAAQAADAAPAVSSPAQTAAAEEEAAPAAQPEKTLSRKERLALRKQAAEERLKGQQTPAAPEAATETAPEPPFGSLEAIAALGGRKANVQQDEKACIVYIFDGEKNRGNPYDVTWDYGEEYNKYVDAADWSPVFDAGYYKAQFPLLAVQYHNDDALLLRHFQTVGIHEGRQGSERFNVAAYMDNCDASLRDAFGDNYECYYLYYLLHQDTEAGVPATGDYKAQLAQELTVIQANELKWINYYRGEAGAGTVEFDGEMAAFANYRAYMDCTEGWDAHDGLENMCDTGRMDTFFDLAHMDTYCENKDTIGGSKDRVAVARHTAYSDYRSSQGHYETMVDPDYGYTGCGNWFVSDRDYNWAGKYEVNCITLDTYADTVSNPFHNQ